MRIFKKLKEHQIDFETSIRKDILDKIDLPFFEKLKVYCMTMLVAGCVTDTIIREGTINTNNGSWVVYYDELSTSLNCSRNWIFCNRELIKELLLKSKEVAEVECSDKLDGGFDCTFWLDYCPYAEKE